MTPLATASSGQATVKVGNVGAQDVYWSSCAPCQWWSDDEPNNFGYTDADRAQQLADEHNRAHHG